MVEKEEEFKKYLESQKNVSQRNYDLPSSSSEEEYEEDLEDEEHQDKK